MNPIRMYAQKNLLIVSLVGALEALLVGCSVSGGTGGNVLTGPSASQIQISGPTTATAGSCVALGATALSAGGTATAAKTAMTVTLTGGGFGNFYEDAACTTLVTSVTIARNANNVAFYFQDNRSESLTLQGAVTSLAAGTLGLVTSGTSATTLAFAAGANVAPPTGICTAYTIQTQDSGGTQQALANPLKVSFTGKGTGTFYSDASCTVPATSVSVALSGAVTVYYVGGRSEVLTLGVDDGPNGMTAASLAATATGGSLDATFGASGILTTSVLTSGALTTQVAAGMTKQFDDKVILVGVDSGGSSQYQTMRVLTSGALDPTWGGSGRVTTDVVAGKADSATSVAVQADGHVVVGGFSGPTATQTFSATRYASDGSLDISFNTTGKASFNTGGGRGNSLAVQIDGSNRPVLAGFCQGGQACVARITTAGTIDSGNFASPSGYTLINVSGGGIDVFTAEAIQADGKIVLAGYANASAIGSSDAQFGLARVNADGSYDTSFSSSTSVNGSLLYHINTNVDEGFRAVQVLSDGGIVAAGYQSTDATNYQFFVAKFASDGTLDHSFGTSGVTVVNFGAGEARATGITQTPDGSFVVGGYYNASASYVLAIAKLQSDGTLNTAFGTAGKRTQVSGANAKAVGTAIDSAGRIVLGGWVLNSSFTLGRFFP